MPFTLLSHGRTGMVLLRDIGDHRAKKVGFKTCAIIAL
jgi:hypothetical protein